MTEGKKPLSSGQLLDLMMVMEKNVDAIKPLPEMATSNPTCDMNDVLIFDRLARQKLGKMTRMLMATANEKDFGTISFMLDEDMGEG